MNRPRLLALLPFLYRGALSIQVFRAMASRGIDVTIAYCEDITGVHPCDDVPDFRAAGDLLDLTPAATTNRRETIDKALRSRGIDVLLQVGAGDLYRDLPYLKEALPRLRIVDTLYNEIGHTLNHFLYEPCIDAVIVESEYMANYVRRATSKPSLSIKVVHNGIDLQAFAPDWAPAQPGNALTLGFLARISPEKNPLGFVDLAERLSERHPSVRFQMYGSGPDAETLRARLAQSRYRQNIQYCGYTEQTRAALLGFDVLVLPSKMDGRPNAIMEASACGVPVLGAPVGGIPELISEGVNGYVVDPREIDAFDALLSKWQSNPATLAQLKRSAHAYAAERFDNQRMFDDYAAAFRGLLGS